MHSVYVVLYRYRGVQRNIEFTLCAFLGGDDNHTVRSARTVYRRGRSILEDLNGLNIIGVELVHTRGRRNTVNDIKRVVGRVQRTRTADTHRSRSGWVTVRRDVHTRHFTLQCFHRVVLLLFLQVGGTDSGHSTGQVRFALRSITGHYHFFQQFAVFRHKHFQILAGAHGLRGIAYVTDFQRRSIGHVQAEITVKIGNCSVGRAFLQYTGSDNRFARCLVDNHTRSRASHHRYG